MHRQFVGWVLVCFCAGQVSRAQEFKVLDRTVQVHGFASQGFVYTGDNNWLTMNTSQGSGAMTDMGLNMSSQLSDKFRAGAQVYDRNLGQLGQWHPSLDWAVADYRFTNWFGIRGGKVKTILGLYNDSQDLDFLRVFALLPQGIYPTDLRDTTIAHAGGDVYGNVPLQHHLGDISYTAYVGHRSDSVYSGYVYLMTEAEVYLHTLGGLQYGEDLRWNTPLKGLTIGASHMNQKVKGKGSFVDLLTSSTALVPYETATTADWTNQFYGQYQLRKLHVDGEYRRSFNRAPYAGAETEADTRAWYISGSYPLSKLFDLGSYYSHYTITSEFEGDAAVLFPSETDTSLPQNHTYDKVVAARAQLNRYVYVKIEGHFMDGYGMGSYPNGFYPQQNPRGFKPTTSALILKTGFHF